MSKITDTQVRVHCYTNLDNVDIYENWPMYLPARPVVGDKIRSTTRWEGGRYLELEVIQCTWIWIGQPTNIWTIQLELHIPRHMKESIEDFQKRYKKIRMGN
jgi:hypothetical protein